MLFNPSMLQSMKENLYIYNNQEELAVKFADQLMLWVNDHPADAFHLAVSGGKTPDRIFSILAEKYGDSRLWQKIHFWWVDERMVAPDHPESNFGTVHRLLFSKMTISEENIHRIKGENNPQAEALSYSEQIKEKVTPQNSWPSFDLVLLGMGDDGHTASIFPDQLHLVESPHICEVAVHPQSGQQRVTITGRVINNASRVCFIVTGSSKAPRMAEILENSEKSNHLPAALIHPVNGNLAWYVDNAALHL